MKKFIIGLFLVLSITLIFISTSAAEIDWQPAPEFIEIGGSLMITGISALEGDIELKHWQVAAERINENGGINGIPVKLVYEDNNSNNPGAIASTNILAYDHEVIACFITVKSTINHALSPLIAEAEMPALYGGSAWSVRQLNNPWMYGLRTNDRNVANIMAKFIVEDLGHTKVASIHSDEAFGQGGNDETIRALKDEYGIEPLTVQKFQRGTLDYTAQLLNIKESGAECIFSWSANPEDDGIILRQIKQLDLDLDFVGGASYGMIDVTVKIAGDDAEGIYSVVDMSPEDPNPTVQYVNDKLSEFGYSVSASGWMYDGLIILADAIERAGVIQEIDGKKMMMPLEDARIAIKDSLKEVENFTEGTCKPYSCDEINDLSHSMTIVRIENGNHKVIKTLDLIAE